MRLYNFARLIKKYGVKCQLHSTTEGAWQAGEWQEGTGTVVDVFGAVVPLTEKRIQNSGGSFKQGDCEFITTTPITLTSDTFLLHNGKEYKLQDATDYSDYADFNIYVARRVSAFDTAGNHANSND